MSLQKFRENIDSIDNEILKLLNERMEVVREIGRQKKSEGSVIYRPEREREIISRLNFLNNGLLNSAAIEAIYLEIFAVSRNLELPERVAYLGPLGSYTHQAAESRFGAMSDYLSMNNISSVFKTVESGRARYGVVPIENNKNGIVGETLDLLGGSSLKIVAELAMPIHHTFATTCDSLKDVRRIYSKDIAFGQCLNFLSEYNLEEVERIPVDSTAKAAQLASSEPNTAAICSHIAAKLYRLPILFENIEDSSGNRTRFVIISDFKNQPSSADKSSIRADISHTDRPGALLGLLSDLNELEINMTKIESRPNYNGRDFGFCFFIDFDGHVDEPHVQELFRRRSDEIKWLGSYPKA
ncbi:MAG: prephenate dehydratase [Wolinella sp.]